MQARSLIDEDAFDRDAEANAEVRVVNVSPYTARIEIATSPGTKPRRSKLEPGQSMFLQHGYCVPWVSVTMKTCAPWIETHTEREAWPGERIYDSNAAKYIWRVPPGPRLPTVVTEDRADAVRAAWDRAMAEKDRAATAPLRLTLQRQDGVPVDVEASIAPSPPSPAWATEPPVPMRKWKAAPPVDEEDQTATVLDDPPPEDNDPPVPEIPTVTLTGAVDALTKPRGRGR